MKTEANPLTQDGRKAYFSLQSLFLCICLYTLQAKAQTSPAHSYPVADAWASNSVNTVIFRKNSLVTCKDTQYIAFYDAEQYVVTGKRALSQSSWQFHRTQYQGNASDAHNVISIMADGEGYLHLAWGMHNAPLNYCKSLRPGSLDLGPKISMTGIREDKVTYPEFYLLSNGDLLFFYRDGGSGNGNMVINRYACSSRQWTQLQPNLIDGGGKRNAYWQACTDTKGNIHLSWVWRESPDVASNHDLCYAVSRDGGITWEKSSGEKYRLPITKENAEYVKHIPENSELINQTSICADGNGHPYIASYWKNATDKAPQYHIVYRNKRKWHTLNLGFRKSDFTLRGKGTKNIPISRPQIIPFQHEKRIAVGLIFRDTERGAKVSMAISQDLKRNKWQITDMSNEPVNAWEPTYDTELWKQKGILDLFVQKVEQVDGEGKAQVPAQTIHILEWKP